LRSRCGSKKRGNARMLLCLFGISAFFGVCCVVAVFEDTDD
jgi:hypothetical protein